MKCSNETVYLAHGWGYGVAAKTSNPYNRLFYHFLSGDTAMPVTPPRSEVRDLVVPTPSYVHDPSCHLQHYDCGVSLADNDPVLLRDRVYVITRTAGRPFFFSHGRSSVDMQIYSDVVHIVGTDKPLDSTYLAGVTHTDLVSAYALFDKSEPCTRCGASPAQGCANAPPLNKPAERASFLTCYCNTSYPMNTYTSQLQSEIHSPGWVVYLDDDNLFLDPAAVSKIVASARSRDDIVLWKAMLGRQTPDDSHFSRHEIVMGDVDSSMFSFHTSHLSMTRWTNRRCADFWTLDSMSRSLTTRWVDQVLTGAHPLRAAAGGLGTPSENIIKVTIVITAYSTVGYRIVWLQNTLVKYCAPKFRDIVDKIIVVWNNPDENPADLHICGLVLVLRPSINSLNNRWIETIPHINTDAIMNLDDDVFVDYDGVICMLGIWLSVSDSSRMVGQFARVNSVGTYVMSELHNQEPYSMLLPRVLMLSKRWLHAYHNTDAKHIAYVDSQAAHCDDVLLNMITSNASSAPLRVQLPPETLEDYYAACHGNHRTETGGLALQKDRTKMRSECLIWFLKSFGMDTLKPRSDVAVCGLKGVRLGITTEPLTEKYYESTRRLSCDESLVKLPRF